MIDRNKVLRAVTAVAAVAVIVCAVVIAARQLGVVDGYDFGAGAYYYADIPGFEKIVNDDAYESKVPVWVHVVIFFAWGWLMWRLWCRIDGK